MPAQHSSSSACQRGPDLVTYLYGEATPAQVADIERHLQDCAACRAELDGFQAVRATLQTWTLDAVTPRIQLVLKPTLWQSLREFFAVLPWWGKLATGCAAAVVVLALVNFRVTVGPQGVSLAFGRAVQPAAPAPPAAGSVAALDPAVDATALRHVLSQTLTEMLTEQTLRREAERDARLQAQLTAQLKQQRTELLRLIERLNREQRLQIAVWLQENERRVGPDWLDLVGVSPAAEGDQ